jgi:hypothetical protein
VLNDFDSLVAVDEGEGPDRCVPYKTPPTPPLTPGSCACRHIVVYQRGFEPEEDIHTLAERAKGSDAQMAATARRVPTTAISKKAAHDQQQMAAAEREALLKVNQVSCHTLLSC